MSHDHHHPAPTRFDHDLRAWLRVALLLGLGLYFAYNVVSGNLANYINARFTWLSVVAAALFLLLAASALLDRLRARAHSHPHHDHHHGPLSWPVLAIIAVPLLLGALIPSRPLGADAVQGSLTARAVGLEGAAFTTDPLEWNVLDWLRAFNASNDLTAFEGQQADVVGFVFRRPDFPPHHFMVARFIVSCCVADASAVGLPVRWAEPVSLPDDTWVRVRGAFRLGDFGGNMVPILHAEAVEPVEEPAHPYLYP